MKFSISGKGLPLLKKTLRPPINHHLPMASVRSGDHLSAALLAESQAVKKDIRAKPVLWPCQAKSLKPFLTSCNPAKNAASLFLYLTKALPLKNTRYGKSPKSNPRLSNTSSIEQPALADTKTVLTSLHGCTPVRAKTSRRLSLT